ncbi:MAG: site-2 protease family protein [Prochloraceae cyanobacterium]
MNGIRVGSLFGIPFYVNPSWFFVLILVTLSYGAQLANQFSYLGPLVPWILGFIAAILLFASVLAHELGHSFVAINNEIEVKSITLFIFGGLATLEKEAKTPLASFYIAIAGPIVSLVLFAMLTAIGITIPLPNAVAAVVSLLAYINLVLGIFNLIPGLPLDGGNILKAIVWKITGNPNKGVLFASRVGQFFGWLAITIGALGVLNILPIGSLWTLLIGWFLLQNAGVSAQSARIQEKLSSYTAEDAVIPDSPIVSGDLNLREFANEYIIGQTKWKKFLVVNETGQLLGSIAVDDMKKIPTSQWTETFVKDSIRSEEKIDIIAGDRTLLEAVKTIEGQNLQQLTVVKEDGVVVGLLEKASIISFLQKEAKANAA